MKCYDYFRRGVCGQGDCKYVDGHKIDCAQCPKNNGCVDCEIYDKCKAEGWFYGLKEGELLFSPEGGVI